MHIVVIATRTKSIVLVTIASENTGIGIEKRQAVASLAACEDAVFGGGSAIEGLVGCEAWVAEDNNGGD